MSKSNIDLELKYSLYPAKHPVAFTCTEDVLPDCIEKEITVPDNITTVYLRKEFSFLDRYLYKLVDTDINLCLYREPALNPALNGCARCRWYVFYKQYNEVFSDEKYGYRTKIVIGRDIDKTYTLARLVLT